MDRGHLLRRAVHISAPAFLVYYLLPGTLMGVPKDALLFSAAALVFAFEAWRLWAKPDIPGMREYEKGRMSAAAWFTLAAVLTLPFFPLGWTMPVFLGMGLVDPLIGELRLRSSRLNPALPTLVYFLLAAGSMTWFYGLQAHVMVAAATATALAIWVEGLKLKSIDDDFSMIVLPLAGIAITFWLLA